MPFGHLFVPLAPVQATPPTMNVFVMPVIAPQPNRSYQFSTFPGILNQGQAPVIPPLFPLTPGALQPNRTYVFTTPPGILNQGPMPFNKYDWPIIPGAPQPNRSYAFNYNFQVAMPFNKYDWPLTPGPIQPNRGYIFSLPPGILNQGAVPVFPPMFPIPVGPIFPMSILNVKGTFPGYFPPPTVTVTLHYKQTMHGFGLGGAMTHY